MEFKAIIITGASGAGKSTIAKKLCEKYEIFKIVQAVTTRESRQDDASGQYQYLSEEEFNALEKQSKLLIKAEYRGKYYGITYDALRGVINSGKTPLLICTPESSKALGENCNNEAYPIFTVFIDGRDDVLDERLRERKENNNIKAQREEDRKYAKDCLYTIKNNENLDDIVQLIYYLWSYRKIGGMLPKKFIELMIKCGMLLENASIDGIQGASYDLTLGDECFRRGKIKTLSNRNPFIEMEPGDYVLVSTKEIANLPKDVSARFDLRVRLFFKGIILSNGTQVDPGFNGVLFCLLFNTSNERVEIKRGEHLATIEFVKLIQPTVPYTGRYQGRRSISEYLPAMVKESAISKLIRDVENLKKEKLWVKILPITISILTVVLTIIFWIILWIRN